MEAPTCPRCEKKHWSREPCAADKSPILVADQTPIKSKVEIKPYARVAVPMKPAERERIAEQPDGTAIYRGPEKSALREKPAWKRQAELNEDAKWDDCPRCAERAAKDAARVKRWREKKK